MIIMQNVTKTFGARFILKSASFHFPEQARIALVGPNGTGKTTLLNILCKQEEYDSGEIVYPKKMRLGYMPQIFNPNPADTILLECMQGARDQQDVIAEREALLKEMEENFSTECYEKFERVDTLYYELGCQHIDHDAKELLLGLGFSEDNFDTSPHAISGGWRMRLELAKILINRPDFLILDEPTNHLDLPSIEFFEQFMLTFKGTLLFVSHDRDLVNRLANHTLHLQVGKLKSHPGNLDSLLKKVEEDNALNEHKRKHIEQRAQHVQSFIDRFRGTPSKIKQVRSRMKMVERLRELEGAITTDTIDYDMDFEVPEGPPSGRKALELKELKFGYDKPLLRKSLSIPVLRGQRVAITGANGLGKSTLLKTIMGEIPHLGGEVEIGSNVRLGYFAQENSESLDVNGTALDNVAETPNTSIFQARSLLGMLGLSGADALKKIRVLSGGEKSRVALAKLLAEKPNVLLLDEPTNHLDMTCEEALALALERFSGTILFVSHNRHFIQSVATHKLDLVSDHTWVLREFDQD